MDETCELEEKAISDGLEQGRKWVGQLNQDFALSRGVYHVVIISEILCRHGVEQGRQDGWNLGVQKGLEIGTCTAEEHRYICGIVVAPGSSCA